MTISTKEMLINEEIREKELRVVGPNGEQLGIMSRAEAQNTADKDGLDLVLIAPQATPPVAKIIDYGKYRFEQTKKEKDAKKNQKQAELKEVRMSLNIDTNDFNTKVNQTSKFLKGGDKVKISVRFKGREMTHINLGEQLIKKFAEACAEFGAAEKPGKLEGRNYGLVLAPKAPVVPPKKPKQAPTEPIKSDNVEKAE